MAHTRDSVMIRLLNYCVQSLQTQGMQKMYLDGIRGGYEGFQSIGTLPLCIGTTRCCLTFRTRQTNAGRI